MWTQEIIDRIKKHEGFRAKIYRDHLGNPTIGYGHLLTEDDDFVEGVIYDKEILEELFNKDFEQAYMGAEYLLTGIPISNTAKGVVIEMVYQLGVGNVSKFKLMLAALKIQDYQEAGKQINNSLFARQTPDRCKELANIMRSCK